MTRPRRASLAELPEMNPGPVCRLDLDGQVELANTAARNVFGRDDLVGRSWLELSPQMNSQRWKQVLSGTEPLQYETEIAEHTYVFTLVHRTDSDHVFVYGTDVSERKKAEMELAELARFPEMNPGPVFRLDREGTILVANAAARRIFGDEDLVGKCWLDVCPDIDPATWQQVLAGTVALRHEAAIGGTFLMFTITHDPDSAYVFVYGSDITDRKNAERALEDHAAERAEMARFPEMNPGPVCRLDHSGNVLLANKAARRVFDDEDLVGKCWLDLCPGMDAHVWDGMLRATETVALEAKVGGRDLVLTHTPGSVGEYVFVYGADITDQKAAERALQQSEKMATLGTLSAGVAHELNNPAAAAQRAAEQLQQAFAKLQEAQLVLGQLSLSDNERDRLLALDRKAREQAACPCDLDPVTRSDRESEVESWLDGRGFDEGWELAPSLVNLEFEVDGLERLQQDFTDSHGPAVVGWLARVYPVYSLLEEIAHGSGRVAEIVMALKAYSYLGQAPIQAVDVNQGLRNTLIILRNKLKAGVTVEQQLADDLPRIQAYGSELNQVWTNLIDNAVGAMDGQGRLTIRTSRQDSWVNVEVVDDGPGIPEEVQSKIFDAFFTTKPPGEGTGLGLHTCYNIVVKKHQGHIDLESQPGHTQFLIKLPIDAGKKPNSNG